MEPESREKQIRSFIAIPLPAPLKQRLDSVQRQVLKLSPGLKPVRPDNLHLTLQFLGDRPQDELAKIAQVMVSVGARKKIFNVHLEGLGIFPHCRRPRVLWIGLSPLHNLQALHTLLREEMSSAGISTEQKPFRPHLTLGRFRDPGKNRADLGHFMTQRYGTLQVDRIVLFGSRLTATGAIHSPLASVTLPSEEVDPQ